MVSAVYSERYFYIVDHKGTSSLQRQMAGIAQGCPLSPYLFIAILTVMMHDVFQDVVLIKEPAYIVACDVLYADDTLLASKHAANLQILLGRILAEGRLYGLELNWASTVHMKISTAAGIYQPDGAVVKSVRQMVYLGALLTCDEKATPEVTRRLGEAHAVFRALAVALEGTEEQT